MTLVEKLDALQEQQSEISALAVKVHILATALNDENAALRAENEWLRGELKRVPNVVSYVTATLETAVRECRLKHIEWGKVHGGRAGSSVRQLEAMADRARAALGG